MKKLIAVLLLGMFAPLLLAQQPQTQTAPTYDVNAKYANGVAPGYAPTAGSGLTLNLGAGTANCSGTIMTYAAGTLTMTASSTNYVYLNTASSCAPAVKTTAFTSSDIPIAQVVAGSSAITSISDVRTPFVTPGSGGGGGGSGPSDTSVAISSGSQGANSCSTTTNVTMTGLTTSMVVLAGYSANPATLTGWGSTGGMVFQIWPSAANTATWEVCNQTGSSITYSAITFNVGAK